MDLYSKIEGDKAHFQEPDIDNEWTAFAFFPTENDLSLTKHLPLALKHYKEHGPHSVVHQV